MRMRQNIVKLLDPVDEGFRRDHFWGFPQVIDFIMAGEQGFEP